MTDIKEADVQAAIRKLKNYKCGGPDNTATELFKALNEEALEIITEVMNEWWTNEKLEREALQARVVHLYKKGCTSDMANYRPISLLNTLYKIFASIVQNRLANGMDKHMLKTQYGSRKARSTQHAIHIIRRVLEAGEITTNKLLLVLLDWEEGCVSVDI